MPLQKVEYEFPHETEEKQKTQDIEIESSSEVEIDVSGKSTAEDYRAKSEPVPAKNEPEIEIVDDTPKADRNRKASEPPADVTDEELEDYSEKVRKRIQHFSKGYHDERRAKEAAERERQEAADLAKRIMAENERLKADVAKNQEALLEQAKKNAEAELLGAKNQFKQAYDSGDGEAVAAAQERLTGAKLRSDRLANVKLPTLQEAENTVQQEEIQSAPAEMDPKLRDWTASNTWFGSDDEMTSFALGLHNKLVKEGVNPSSDDYYQRIDARMRQVFPDQFEDTDSTIEEEVETPTPSSNVVAPATRSTAPKKIRLTQTQVTLAKRLGLTPEQYALQVAKDMRNENG